MINPKADYLSNLYKDEVATRQFASKALNGLGILFEGSAATRAILDIGPRSETIGLALAGVAIFGLSQASQSFGHRIESIILHQELAAREQDGEL